MSLYTEPAYLNTASASTFSQFSSIFYNEKNSEIKIGFRFVFQSPSSTITEREVNDIIGVIIKHTENIKGVTIPGLK